MLGVFKSLLWLAFAFINLVIFFAAVNAGVAHQQTTANLLWITFVLAMVILWWLRGWILYGVGKKEINARQKMLEDFQANNNFNCDRALVGTVSILFDTKARRMAFFDGDNVVEYPYSYIRSWEQRWTYRGTKTYNHRFDLQLNDLNRPLLTIIPGNGWSAGNKGSAEQWDAMLDLILSS